MIQIDVDSKDLEVRLRGLEGALEDFRPVWPDVKQILMDFLKQHFQSEGAYSGTGWVPLSPGYAAWKLRHYPNKTILRRTDRLFDSLTQPDQPDQVFREEADWMEFGTAVPYARAHHFGAPARNLPARPVIGEITRAEGERFVDAVLAYLFKRMHGEPAR